MIKVKHTKIWNTIPVAEAKLVLVPIERGRMMYLTHHSDGEIEFNIQPNDDAFVKSTSHGITIQPFKPILISETEEIEAIFAHGQIHKPDPSYRAITNSAKKILALPEHFSPEQLQMIVDGRLKDGDKVLVECEKYYYSKKSEVGGHDHNYFSYQIKLNSSNHITLHKVEERMYTREEVSALTHKLLTEHNNSLPDVYSQMDKEELDEYHKEWFEQNVLLIKNSSA